MKSRPYQMTARADAAALTGQRILDATLHLWGTTSFDQIRLEAVAEAAEVTVPTVVRRFGGKAGIVCALVDRELSDLSETRPELARASSGEIIDYLVAFYERYGLLILKLYAEASHVEGLPERAARARSQHVAWIREAFEDRLTGGESAHDRRMAQVIAILDATTWRILRHEEGLPPDEVRTALGEQLALLVRRTASHS